MAEKSIWDATNKTEPCPCGSGNSYKYCCFMMKRKTRLVEMPQDKEGEAPQEMDVGAEQISYLTNIDITLKNFCKDNGYYWFTSGIDMKLLVALAFRLKEETLTISLLMQVYKARISKKIALQIVAELGGLHPDFSKRAPIIEDAVTAHFDGRYSLSVPALFPQIEGWFRAFGNLSAKDDFKPTIPRDIWNERRLAGITDSAVNFNAYLTNLFRGSAPNDSFSRNAVLHGMNAGYATEENSLTLILIVLEIRNFLWLEKSSERRY